ncbi:hypothetical protein BCR36DRAFT_584681 [Piromyces finnis]|uniref:Metallo-beta-lactamase domain-containing protein n=1 Tax=Piromyces finnis TaxID=1754191 RepID=A0A1Y1V602_9FUNG|nr:hypothetical protein BCR36DRAFT_584681 [Piromyces finnis]|eukprot:ORX47586.1 hypothetical protein BCR36DRAFT_584681 [Piromyces finnis]
MDLCFSLKCTKSRDDDYKTRSGNLYTIPNYVTDDYILSCHTNNFNTLINLKNNGNRHYKSYKFHQAVQCYTKALASFRQEKNINHSKNNDSDSFDLSNVGINTTINEIDQNKVNSVVKGHKKNSQSIPTMSSSIISVPSHITSPLASSNNINIVSNSKNNVNVKQFPVSETSSYKIQRKISDDEYSNALEKYFEENNGMEASFSSTIQRSDSNIYQNQMSNQAVDLHRRKPKNKNHKNNSKPQPIYAPHPKVKSNDVMILYSTLLANRSASYIRLKDYNKANIDAEYIIGIRPNWIKGYYRKAEALKGLKRYLESLDYYHQALKFNPSSEKILNAISTVEILLRNEELGIKIYQLVPGYDICVKKSIFKPIQYILFSYALQMQNYIYILADTKTKQCILIDACWDIDGILDYVNKEKLKVIGAIYTHFHIDHTGGIPPPPYNKYMVKVEGMVKLSKIFPNIPFFIGPRDIDFVLKQNPDFNKNRFVPIEDKQVLTLDDIIQLNKSKVKRRSHVNEKIRNTSHEKLSPSKQSVFNVDDEAKEVDEIIPIKNEIASDYDAIIEKEENFNTQMLDKNSNIESHYKFNNKIYRPVRSHLISDYKIKHISNINEDPLAITEDTNTEIYSNFNLNDDLENEFNNVASEASAIENSNIGNISNICYDGENSLKFYSNLSEHDGNKNMDNKVKIPQPGNQDAPITSTLDRPKKKSIEDNKSNPYSDSNRYGKINDTISTISMINIDKKDYSSNLLVKSSQKIDDFRIQFIFTPGHTLGSMCILVNDERLFSGDTLLIGTCGRIDLPESSPEEMYDSLMNVLSRLDDDIVVYPGHSYGGDEWTTIAQEKLFGSMYNYGSYDLWHYELTGCNKNSDESIPPNNSTNTQENKNEEVVMTPMLTVASPIKTNFDSHPEENVPGKELKDTNEKEVIVSTITEPVDDEEKITEIRIGPAKRYDEKKGYFSNYEYFDMNNINSNNKYYKPSNAVSVTTIPLTSSVNNLPVSNNTNTTTTPSDNNVESAHGRAIDNNKNNIVLFNKRKESLSNKPYLQKQSSQKQTQLQEQNQAPTTKQVSPPPPLQTESPEEINKEKIESMKFEIDQNNFRSVKSNTENKGVINIKSNSTNVVVDVNPIENKDQAYSLSSTSESISITSTSNENNYTSNSNPVSNIIISEVEDEKKSYSIKSSSNKIMPIDNIKDDSNHRIAVKQVIMLKDGEKLEMTNGLVDEVSPAAINSYDHIITSSIKEQFNKSSELEESFESENYYKNKNILSELSQSSYATSSTTQNTPHDKHLIMTEMYPSIESDSSSIEEDNNGIETFYIRGDKIRKRQSFLNNVFKKRSFDRKHQKHQTVTNKTEE